MNLNNKNIVLIRSNPVDPDPRVEKEANSLCEAGYNVTILAWDRNNSYKIKEFNLNSQTDRIKVIRFGILATYGGGIKKNFIPLVKFQFELFKWLIINRHQYNIIHSCDFDTAFISYICNKFIKKKLIYDIFDYYVDSFNVPVILRKFIEKIDRKIINSADSVIICTEKRKEQIKGTKPKKLVIIHNSPKLLLFDPSDYTQNSEKIKIAYVGILQNGRLLKELANFAINNSNYELHIGGFGQLENYFKDLALNHKNIIYYGRLNYYDTQLLENSCDIITAIYDPNIRNHYFAAPNKFYEALMLGKPIIMVKNTGMAEVIIENKIGEVIEYSSKGLEEGIENLIARKAEWPSISNTMKQLYYRDYAWEKMSERLKELYNEINV